MLMYTVNNFGSQQISAILDLFCYGPLKIFLNTTQVTSRNKREGEIKKKKKKNLTK